MTLSALLTALRKRKGLSIRALAALIDASHSSVWDYVTGRTPPSASMLGKMLNALDASEAERLSALQLSTQQTGDSVPSIA